MALGSTLSRVVDMRLDLQQSGGFGALSVPAMFLDASDVTPEEADELARMVDAAERAPLRQAPARPVPDAMQYDLTIRRGGAVSRLHFDDVTATPELRRLIERIEALGRPR